jgi:mitochondrial fission protein ELM1
MTSAPRVWVLLGRGAGGNGQMRALAQALGWPTEFCQLDHNQLQVVPNLLLGATRATLSSRADPLTPPWPDVVIAAGRRSAPVALWIRAQSARDSGRPARLVHLLQAQAPLDPFDLVVSLPQYRLPVRENVLEVTGALNAIDPASIRAAGEAWTGRFDGLPRPWIAVVVGGDSSSYRFDSDTASCLGREASAEAAREGGSLLVSTTPRTTAESTDVLAAAIDAPNHFYRWRPDDADNPYRAYLALADRFIVTVDSASLPMEACATGRPVQVFEWPRKGRAPRPMTGFYRRIVELGLVKPTRDFDAYHRALREQGLVTRLGEGPPRPPSHSPDDLERVVARVRALMSA